VKQQQRRVFLQVIAVSPLLGCGGMDPSAPDGFGSSAGRSAGGSAGAIGSPPIGGGGNPSHGAGGSPSPGGGNGSGGSPLSTTGGESGAPAGQSGAPGQAGASAASGASSGGAGVAGGSSNNPATAIGNVSSYPLGSFSIAGSIYFMGHDAGGLYAMSMQCTHAGCAVDIKGSELNCPCHASRFDRSGNVLAGPAKTPLPHYKVSVDASGNITVDRFTIVSMSTRTPV
jgi:nitrite reductase/ring-hydroxylating ferredoxin subunit